MAERVFSFPSHLAGLALAGEFEAGDQRGSFPPLTLSASLAAMMSVSLGCRRSATERGPRVKSSVSHFWRQELQDHGGSFGELGAKAFRARLLALEVSGALGLAGCHRPDLCPQRYMTSPCAWLRVRFLWGHPLYWTRGPLCYAVTSS